MAIAYLYIYIYLCAIAGQQLDLGVVEWRQTLEKVVLLVAGFEGHYGLRTTQEKRHRYGETGHVHGVLATADPAIVEARQLAVAHDRTAHAELGDQTDRPH